VRTKEASNTSSFRHEPPVRLLLLGTLFVGAFCLRLYRIGEPLFDFVAVRQYHSALLARGFHEWLLTGDLKTLPSDGIIEPPILDFLASLAYMSTGGEHLWIPRVLSASFWMIGGVFLYLIARKIVSPNAACFAVAFFLLEPAVVLPSRAFMPDPLMIMMLVISVYTILRYHEQPSTGRLVVAGVASSLALFVKPGICLFQILGALVVPMLYRNGQTRTLKSVHLVLFTMLSLVPVGLYYVYGRVIRGFLDGQVQGKVVPHYLLESYFWRGWLQQIESMVGLIVFLGAILGVMLLRPGLPRTLMAGLWGGYFLFGLVFTYHIHTHDYYSLQFVPVIALSLGSLCDAVERHTAEGILPYLGRMGLLGLIFLVVVVTVVEQRPTIEGIAYQASGEKPFPGRLKGTALVADYQARAEIYKDIGNIVGHSSSTIYSAPDFGVPLRYHGRIDGEYWPTPGMLAWWQSRGRESKQLGGASSRRELFDQWYSEASPNYFIVIRSEGWGEDRMLRRLLKSHFIEVTRNRYYLIFDLRQGDYRTRSG
jgi:Dolichyl-phosphate-mannose-protein mannosyltransferase